jgi:hypothetical protein
MEVSSSLAERKVIIELTGLLKKNGNFIALKKNLRSQYTCIKVETSLV